MKKIGWNTKGVRGVEILPSFQEWLKGQDFDEVWLRVQGGTISQKAYNADWTDDMIEAWANLYASDDRIKLVYVVNLNQSPQDEQAIYNRMKDNGLEFEFIEFGNEQYLRKFRDNHEDKEEVTDRTSSMTPNKYLSLCSEYDFFTERWCVQLAPNRGDGRSIDSWFTAWNESILNQTIDTEFAYSMHVYPPFRFDLITVVQNRTEKPILFTEFGGYDVEMSGKPDSYEEFVSRAKDFAEQIAPRLGEQDIAFSQVLWNNFKDDTASDFKDGALTEKGQMIVDVFATEAEQPEQPEKRPPLNYFIRRIFKMFRIL